MHPNEADRDVPRLTNHVAEQFKGRANDDTVVGPIVAWMEGTEMSVPQVLHADECRYHEPSGVVLLRKGPKLVTAIDVDTAKPEVRARAEIAARQTTDRAASYGGSA